ncbi:hypothetical protein [Kingella oralis]|nr:hypothetical protein [Kingella oralis]
MAQSWSGSGSPTLGLTPAPLIQCTIWQRTVAISSNNFQAAYRIR